MRQLEIANFLDPHIGPNRDEILRRYWRRSIEGPNVVGQFFWVYLLFVLVLWSFWVGPINFLAMGTYIALLLVSDLYNLSIGVRVRGDSDAEIDAERTSVRLGIFWIFRLSSLTFMLLTFGYVEGDTGRQLLLMVFPLLNAHNPSRDSVYWRQVVGDIITYLPMGVMYWLDTGIKGWPVLVVLILAAIATLVMRRGMYLELCASINNEVQAQRLAGELEAQNQELDEARKLANAASNAKTRFLATASHDLRQPIQAAVLFADLLHDQVARSEQHLTERLKQSLGSMSGLLGKLLDISKLDAGIVQSNPSSFALDGLLRSVVNEVAVGEESLPTIKIVRTSVWVNCDPIFLHSIVQNLVVNAIHHANCQRILLGIRKRGARAQLIVADDGTGINETDQTAIFQEFHQLETDALKQVEGMGLGLSISRRLAELMDCELDVQSRPPNGTRFWISLPISEPITEGETEKQKIPEFAGLGAIIIDDDDQIRRAMRETLRSWDMAVYDTDGAVEPDLFAVDIDPDDIDVIISDFSLGQEWNGLEYAGSLKDRLERNIPVVVISGDLGRAELQLLEREAGHYLSKPVSAGQLRETLAKLLS